MPYLDKKVLVSTAVAVAILALADGTRVAAQELSPLLTRLDRGDYAWSLDFARENAEFLGYVSAFAQSVRAVCDEYPASMEERQFPVVLISSRSGPLSFDDVWHTDPAVAAAVSAAIAASWEAAENEVKALLKSRGCAGLRRLMENAKRVLEGRRPVHGGPAHTTLIDESIVRPSAKHNYFSRTRTPLGWMTSTELAVFERHLAHEASLGTRILECTYDTVPTDKIREVQYYWSAPLTYLSTWYPRPETFGIRHSSLKALELALSRASHEGRVRHPFRDYGPPRNECPARLDPALPRREIVDVVVERRPTIAASSVTVVRNPVIKQESNDTLNYDYGPAPENFVPPIPALDAMGVSITMEKQGAGALSRVRVWSADSLFGRFYQTPDWKEWLKTRPADAKLVSSDFVAASLDSSRNSAKYRPGKSLGMDCSYLDEQLGFIESVYFWFKTRPEVAEPLRLKARVADHPMLQIKSPRDSCPATLGEARALK